jgi:hypothetical protein
MGDKMTFKKLSGIFLSPDLSIEFNLERHLDHFGSETALKYLSNKLLVVAGHRRRQRPAAFFS